jgi:hypothetical protein
LVEHIFNNDGEGLVEFLKGDKLHQEMDKFTTLCSPNIRNLVALFKHHLDNKGYIDNILALKFKNVMITFRIIVFLDKCLQKKCSSSRCLSREMAVVVTVKRMQPRANFETCWLMFDRIKHVGWMALTCHMYDLVYYKMMMIVMCDMQLEDIEVQNAMW